MQFIVIYIHLYVIALFFRPTPEITWNKPSRNLNNVDCTKEFNTECRIEKVQIANAGIYQCTGKNEHDEITTDIHLKVEGKKLS